jgi:hypothetical protein
MRAPPTAKLFDAAGESMSPSTSRGKSGRSYRYYVSAPLQQGGRRSHTNAVQRLSAPEIERAIAEAIRRWLPKAEVPFSILRSVHFGDRGLQVTLDAGYCTNLAARLSDDEAILDRASLSSPPTSSAPSSKAASRITSTSRSSRKWTFPSPGRASENCSDSSDRPSPCSGEQMP